MHVYNEELIRPFLSSDNWCRLARSLNPMYVPEKVRGAFKNPIRLEGKVSNVGGSSTCFVGASDFAADFPIKDFCRKVRMTFFFFLPFLLMVLLILDIEASVLATDMSSHALAIVVLSSSNISDRVVDTTAECSAMLEEHSSFSSSNESSHQEHFSSIL
jgi:hypothetical protein